MKNKKQTPSTKEKNRKFSLSKSPPTSIKYYSKFEPDIHQGTDYLMDYISQDPDNERRFICHLCSENKAKYASGYCNNLKDHLLTSQHQNLHKGQKELKQLQESVTFLQIVTLTSLKKESKQDIMEEEEEILEHIRLEDQEKEEEKGETNTFYQIIRDHVPKNKSQMRPSELKLKLEVLRFIVSNNLPFSLGSRCLDFLKVILNKYTPAVINNTKINNSLATIAQQIGTSIQEEIFSQIEKSPFSISVDEASDKFGREYLALCVRYYQSEDLFEPTTSFLGLLELGTSYTGETLYNLVTDFVFNRDNGDQIKANFMGICSDHASNMISGGSKGLSERLRKDFPHIFVIHDYPHALNLIIKEALSKFPQPVLDSVREICTHFSNSPQRKAKFREVQKTLGNQSTLETLRYVEHRWFSLRDCVNRILELWSGLTAYFQEEGTKHEQDYFSKKNKSFLKLLSCLLGKLNYYNVFFQGENLQNDKILETLRECFTVMGDLVVEGHDDPPTSNALEKRFDTLHSINFSKKDEYQKYLMKEQKFEVTILKEFQDLSELLKECDTELKSSLLKTALEFIITSLNQMQIWLPYNEKALFDMEVIYFTKFNTEIWERLKNRFSNIIPEKEHNDFVEQLRRFKYSFSTLQSLILSIPALKIWRDNQNKYPLLYKLAKALMVVPYSSCSLERIFSQFRDIKTIKRNRLTVKSLEACLLLKQKYGDDISNVNLDNLVKLVQNPSNTKQKEPSHAFKSSQDSPFSEKVFQGLSKQNTQEEDSLNNENNMELEFDMSELSSQIKQDNKGSEHSPNKENPSNDIQRYKFASKRSSSNTFQRTRNDIKKTKFAEAPRKYQSDMIQEEDFSFNIEEEDSNVENKGNAKAKEVDEEIVSNKMKYHKYS